MPFFFEPEISHRALAEAKQNFQLNYVAKDKSEFNDNKHAI